MVSGRAVQAGVRRLNVGGRLMTSYLKEVLSYRQYNMMDETVLVSCACLEKSSEWSLNSAARHGSESGPAPPPLGV